MSSTIPDGTPSWLQSGTRAWWIVYLFGPVVLLGVGLVILPRLVCEQYIWQYLWGPVVADAAGQPVTRHDITATWGYNPANTITYLAIVLYALPGIQEGFDTFEIDMNARLAYGLTPIVAAGGVMRALQDTGLLPFPFDRLFLTPLIYIVMAGVTIVLLLGAVAFRERSGVRVPVTVGSIGIVWTVSGLGIALAYGPWMTGLLQLWVPIVVLVAALLVTAGTYVAGDRFDWPAIQHSMVLLLVFGQMVDATQILIGVTVYDYEPKLFITRVVYETTGIPGSTFGLKLGATLLIVWGLGR